MQDPGMTTGKQGGQVDMSLESGMQTSQSLHSQLSSSALDGSEDDTQQKLKLKTGKKESVEKELSADVDILLEETETIMLFYMPSTKETEEESEGYKKTQKY